MTADAEIQTALPALASGNVAVITGGASGIGLAAAKRLAAMGLKIVLADIGGARLDEAARAVATIAGDNAVLAVATDVAKADEVDRLAEKAFGTFGDVSLLMNNAASATIPAGPGRTATPGSGCWISISGASSTASRPSRRACWPRGVLA